MKGLDTSVWAWAEVRTPSSSRQPKIEPSRSSVPKLVFQLAIPLAVAALVWSLGHVVLAAVIAGIGVLLTVLQLAWPTAHQLIMSLLIALGTRLGWLVSAATLTVLYSLLFVPVALVSRFLRRDPLHLRLERSHDAPTYFVPAPRVDPKKVFDKPFLVEADPGRFGAPSPKPLRVGRAIYHTALTLLLLNFGIGFVYHRVTDSLRKEEQPRSDLAVYRDVPWAKDYFDEFAVANPLEYRPFLGWSRKDFKGEFINVDGGCRKSYRSPKLGEGRVLVYAFGGSTMWGTGARDDYTIPSYLVKLAERDDLPVEIRNYGETGFVNWQSVLRLAELCAAGEVPDVVIFYEGANDAVAKLQTPSIARPHLNYADWAERNSSERRRVAIPKPVASWFVENSALHMLGRKLGGLFAGGFGTEESMDEKGVDEMAREIIATYRENAAFVDKLASAYGFKTRYFWQPLVYTRRQLTDVERDYVRTDFGELLPAVYRAATRIVQSSDFASDLSRSFDEYVGTVYIDFAHVTEKGNELVAQAMYRQLRGELRQ